MTEKRFIIHGDVVSDTDMKIPITLWSDKKQQKKFCDELNALHEENQLIKKHIRELYKFVKIDVDNEIEVYPSALLEGIVDILKIIGDFE